MAKKDPVPVVAEAKPKKSRKKWIVLGVILVVILVLVGVGYSVARKFTGPAIGTVVQSTAPDEQLPPTERAQFDGTSFSFVHPITYIEQAVKPTPGDLEDRSFLSTGMKGGVLTIVITKAASGNLDDNTAYVSRNQDTKKYQRKLITIKNEQVTIFTSNDGQQLQQTAFWLHQGKLLTFSLTGIATDVQSAESDFLSMVESITWH